MGVQGVRRKAGQNGRAAAAATGAGRTVSATRKSGDREVADAAHAVAVLIDELGRVRAILAELRW